MIFSLSASAQCGVRDLPDSTQKKILLKFTQLEYCDSLRLVDSTEIIDLRSDKLILQNENKRARLDIDQLNLKLLKRRKIPYITGAVGVIVGVFIGARIK